MKKRLFIALGATEIADEAQVYLKKIKINFKDRDIGVQWTPPENWHITLVFLGPTDQGALPDVEKAIERACHRTESFKLKVSDFGAFPSPQQARVVWLGVQRSQNLLNLQSRLETELAPLGFAGEDRDYWPHLTIGRLRNHKNIVDALSPVVRKSIGTLCVKDVRLYESVLAAPYPRYLSLRQFVLPGIGEIDASKKEEQPF